MSDLERKSKGRWVLSDLPKTMPLGDLWHEFGHDADLIVEEEEGRFFIVFTKPGGFVGYPLVNLSGEVVFFASREEALGYARALGFTENRTGH